MPVLSGETWSPNAGRNTISWSFAASNYEILADHYSTYKTFSSFITGQNRDVIRSAFAAWAAVANIDFVEVEDAAEVDIRLGNYNIDGRAAVNGYSTLAETGGWQINGRFYVAQIAFDVDAYDGGGFYGTAVHEIGHALGLDHSPLANAVMYATLSAANRAGTLTSDDIEGIVSLYGPRSAWTPPPADDFAGSTATTGIVAVGGSVTGAIETKADTDWFKVMVTAGHTYRFDLEGRVTNGGTLIDALLGLRSASGALLVLSDDEGEGQNSQITYRANASGPLYLAAAGHPTADPAVGTYRLSVTDLTPPSGSPVILAAGTNILRQSATSFVEDLAVRAAAGSLTSAAAVEALVKAADATTSVATMSYEFFTGRVPTQAGLDFLVSPTGPNSNNINSAYYQSFSLENRYINFAVNLGKVGEGAARFTADYGALTLAQATQKAYGVIFGAEPTSATVSALLDPVFVLNGKTLSRAQYFEAYGRDGPSGIGTKAAMVGWLLAEAEKADLGQFARSNHDFLTDLADGAAFGVDVVGVYGKPAYVFGG